MNIISEIKNDLLECKIIEVKKSIYAILIDDDYDRAMLFCRYQEFYESPFKDIKGKSFDLMSYMKIYKNHKKTNVFTYPDDWMGYNIPSFSLKACMENVFETQQKICGINSYDHIMKDIVEIIHNHLNSSEAPFYLLGVNDLDSSIMEHEIAHGIFYTNKEYQEKTIEIYNNLPNIIKDEMRSILLKIGYCDDVIIDEIQAYMSCELTDKMSLIDNIEENREGFKTLFNLYKN